MGDIAVVMITVDRTPNKSYLEETLINLNRSGVFSHQRLEKFWLIDSGGSVNYPPEVKNVPCSFCVDSPEVKRCANENTARALELGASVGTPWVLFIEDDVDVCADYIGSVGRWLDRHAREDRPINSFGACYPNAFGKNPAWDYPVCKFYGTQSFAITSENAKDLSKFLMENIFTWNHLGHAYDISMHYWAKQKFGDDVKFLATAPAFVQHIGRNSSVGSPFFEYPSWQGREWKYD